MSEERFWRIVSRKLAGHATEQELHELEKMKADDKQLESLYNQLISGQPTFSEADLTNAQQAFAAHFVKMQLEGKFAKQNISGAANKIQHDTGFDLRPSSKKRRLVFSLSTVAACGMLVFIGYSIYFKNNTGKTIAVARDENVVTTKKGSRSLVQLPDGTQVWLNADSKITYPENFRKDIREVRLTGEAFFDVVKDKSHPFLIHTAVLDLKVLGTAFNVRSYPNEKNTEAALIRGSIEVVVRKNPGKKIILSPNQKLIVKNTEPGTIENKGPNKKMADDLQMIAIDKIKVDKKDSSAIETAWVRNTLAFDGESLEDIARSLERWYDVHVIFKNEKLKKLKFTAAFNNKSLKQVMDALQFSGGFNYSIENGQLVIG